ncbi:helix-turn-helix transcriptional regulator [bacterium]|jgi:transcriptional regulator with XRE-family HTH domain|nr:helix-turn-helix transcriptional regulator [bacterium]
MRYQKQLARYLKMRRVKTKKSLNLFCEENHIEPSTLSRIENGILELKISNLVKIAMGLDSTPANLLADFEDYLLQKHSK